jgi:hypothetical protein
MYEFGYSESVTEEDVARTIKRAISVHIYVYHPPTSWELVYYIYYVYSVNI